MSGVTKVGLCGFTIGAAAYYETFPVLEVQQTFYDPPPAATIRRWREQSPPGFEFTMKAWQVITHRGTSRTYKRMKRPFTDAQRAEAGAFALNSTTRAAYELTMECARLLRATAVLFQCPASFRPTEENVANMRRFFGEVPRREGVRFLWEPRGEAWSDDVVAALCRELDLIHAVDPFVRPSLTPAVTYWRLHGIGNHYHHYTDDELASLLARVDPAAETYVMFNNIPRPGNARRFMSMVNARTSRARER
jgi:uncharacterized protein YecE (DUF72 family)